LTLLTSNSGRLRSDDLGTASFSVLAVLLLLACTCSVAAMQAYRGSGLVGEAVSLEEAEAELEAFLDSALDEAIGAAVPRAAEDELVSLEEALDAALVPVVLRGAPATAGGWTVAVVEVEGGMAPGPACHGRPAAELVVDLGGRHAPGALRLVVSAAAAGGEWDALAARAASVARDLSCPGGAVAYGAGNILWREAQGRAISGSLDPSLLVPVEGVLAAVEASLASLVRSGAPPAPTAPSVDLGGLVGQSVAGLVERDLGWLDGYLGGVPDVGPVAGLRDRAASGLADVVLEVLEGASVAGLPALDGGNLEEVVAEGLSVLDGLGEDLSCDLLEPLVASWLEETWPQLPGKVLAPLASPLSSLAVAAGGLGVVCARDALLGLGRLGRQLAPTVDATPPSVEGLRVDLEGLYARADWSGVKATDPPDLLSGEGGDVPALGSLPYTSTCRVVVSGEAVVSALAPGASGRGVEACWRVPVDLDWRVGVVTGRPLEGVAYAASATLAGDLASVAGALWEGATGSLGWLASRLRDAAETARAWAVGLLADMRASVMTESAYTLSRALWGIGEALFDNETGDALNGTWDLFVDLFGEDLREALTWELEMMGCRFVVALDPARQQVEVRTARDGLSMNVTVRRLSDPHPPFRAKPVEGYRWGVFGEGRLDAGGRRAVIFLDPLTLERDSVLTLEMAWGAADDGGKVVLEALEARRLKRGWTVSLSEVSGAGRLLSLAGGGLADAGLALHGDLMEEGAARDALRRALKDAWLGAMRGWSVGDLVGDTGRGPDAGTFVGTLMRELHAALVQRGGRLLSEVEVFLEVEFPAPGWPSLRLSLVLKEPLEALLPLATWVRRSLETLVGGAVSGSVEGAGRGLATWIAEHLVVRFELAWAVEPPRWLEAGAGGGAGLPERLGLLVRGEANVAALAALAGSELGEWSASVEVCLRGVPGALLAVVPGMGSPKWRWAEVTLLRGTVREVATSGVLVAQVLYDAAGRDADLEYVELLNGGRHVVDLRGYRLCDDAGRFELRGHMPVLPGDRVLVARNSSALRGRWGTVPDVGRMTLRLANDGDVLSLEDPSGRVLDVVAWEGHLEGWEGLEAAEGRALLRIGGDLRPRCSSAWYVGHADPVGSSW
jgi:hypothetical protein